jgi:hypothetical protein
MGHDNCAGERLAGEASMRIVNVDGQEANHALGGPPCDAEWG